MEAESSLDVLLAQSRWVERVALGILGDEAAAADVAQEARIQAWQRPPATGAGRPWMVAVGRRLAANRLRREARFARRERLAARDEALPSTSELVEQAETRRLVAEEVVELADPYRTVLLLRYFKDLSSAEIAGRQGIPAATVRSQIQRGLELLRARLEQRLGGAGRCRRALAGLVALPPASMSSPLDLWKGVLAVKGATQLAVLVLVLASVAGVWWQVGRSEASLSDEVATVTDDRTRTVDAPAVVAGDDDAEDRRRLDPVVAATAEPAVEEVAPAAETKLSGVVRARVVDPAGSPLAGVELSATGLDERTVSGPDGELEVAFGLRMVERATPVELSFEADGYARRFQTVYLLPGDTKHLGRVELAPGARVTGRVLDPFDRPLADARVLVTGLDALRSDADEQRRHGPALAGSAVETRSGHDGRFTLSGVTPGFVRVWAGLGGYGWTTVGPLEAGVEPDAEVVLELAPLVDDDRILAVVLSPAGEPVPNALVRISYRSGTLSSGTARRADEQGRFELLVDHRVPHALRIEDPEDRWTPILANHVEPGATRYEFQFELARYVDVTVRDQNDRPVESFVVAAPPREEPTPGISHGPLERADADPERSGFARLRVPCAPFHVTVDAEGHAVERLGPFTPDDVPPALDVSLRALPGLAGVVVEGGEPVAGATVGLVRAYGLETVCQVNGFRALLQPYEQATAETDSDGRFHLPLRGSGSFVLHASVDGELDGTLGPLAFEEDEGARDLLVEVSPYGALRGRVVAPDGRDTEGTVVAINQGRGEPFTLRAGPGGGFEVELPAGPVQVLARDEELEQGSRSISAETHPEPVAMEWSTVIDPGRVTHFDLELGSRAGGRLSGTLAIADPAGWTVDLQREPIGSSAIVVASTTLGAEGTFELLFSEPGEHVLVLRAPFAANGLVVRERLELVPGDHAWSLELACGRVELDPASGFDRDYRYVYDDASHRFPGRALSASIDVSWVDGWIELPLVPAGHGVLEVFEPDPSSGAGSWVLATRFDVAAEATTTVTLP